MRFVFLVMLMTSAMVGLITWATRPDLVEAQYNRLVNPIEQHFAAKRAAIWQAAKEQAWREWSAQVRMPGDCARPVTSIRELECRNQQQLHAASFERAWAEKIAGGWRPEGAD
jgi:hypothetical protein